ncbi:hypothetical protein BO71DRAFT_129998 [Aspergillus ellipticus CBS 707.79]|uniref:Uncharacterized protein n=1 Tax=Aspergillus ellipticus CBS 707.79 TaxID=1448320 RepID=A0A319DIU8_9EURO|nr:hypothetical protein BO71DRAFT_129998 [Aspergillus ellipticus CBS 707.79]
MCHQFFMVYEWCQCQEDAGQQFCSERNENNYCPDVAIDVVHMHCFCHSHATRGFKSEKKSRKLERKLERKRLSTLSLDEKSLLAPPKKKWYRFSLRSRTF